MLFFRRRDRQPNPFVTILTVGNHSSVSLVQARLDDAGVKYAINSNRVSDLFGWGRLGGYNYITGPVRIMVSPEDADRAKELLYDLTESRQRIPLWFRLISTAILATTLWGLVMSVLLTFGIVKEPLQKPIKHSHRAEK